MCRYHINLVLSVIILFQSDCWHIYDAGKDVSHCSISDTIANRSKTAALSDDEIQRWKLWPGLMSEFDKEKGETIFGYRDALDLIWKHQHPADCKSAKFLVADGWDAGFGSEIHVLGQIFALAFRMNRVLTLSPDRAAHKKFRWWTNNTFCKQQSKMSILCYYEPLTHCTDEDIYGPDGFNRQRFMDDSKNVENDKKTYISIPDIARARKSWNLPQKFLVMHCWMGNADRTQKYIPDIFQPLLDCSPIPDRNYFYWWRALTASYLTRPNQQVLALIRQHSDRVHFNQQMDTCVSVYVRRGDKHVEMAMAPLTQFSNAVLMLESTGQLVSPTNSSGGSHKHIYFGSEDYESLQKMSLWGSDNGWIVHYSEFFDRREVSTGIPDYDKQNVLSEKGLDVHHELEYFAMVFDLDKHLKCEAFVCTIQSNFCRLIDELRATVGGKANRHYVDIRQSSEGCCTETDKACGGDLGW